MKCVVLAAAAAAAAGVAPITRAGASPSRGPSASRPPLETTSIGVPIHHYQRLQHEADDVPTCSVDDRHTASSSTDVCVDCANDSSLEQHYSSSSAAAASKVLAASRVRGGDHGEPGFAAVIGSSQRQQQQRRRRQQPGAVRGWDTTLPVLPQHRPIMAGLPHAQPQGRMVHYLQQKSADDGDVVNDLNKHGNDDDKDDTNNHGMFSGALHQVEHRAREKTSIKLGEKAAGQVMKVAERKGISRLAERAVEFTERIWERLTVGRVGRRAAQHAGERGLERVGERAGETFGERFVERFGDQVLSTATRSSNAAATAGERIGQKALSRAERRMATGVAERAGERATERSGQRLAERAAERTIAKRTQSGYSTTARRTVARHVAELGERASETGLVMSSRGTQKVGSAVAVRSTERIARSVARVFLIMLPALGGFFALWLLKADLKRIGEVREERSEFEWRVSGTVPTKRPCLTSLMFGGAAIADLVDAIAHFVIAYAVLIELGHSKILKWEEISMICAVVSTVFAVLAEVVDYRQMRKVNAVSAF